LLRDVAQENRISMERFADELEARLSTRTGVQLTVPSPPRPRQTGRGRIDRASAHAARYARYPWQARSYSGDVFHIVDQGYADLVSVLPAERCLVTCHDLSLLRARGAAGFSPRRLTVARFRLSAAFLRRVGHVACVSATTRSHVHELLGVAPERTSVVQNGVSEIFAPQEESSRERLREALPGTSRWVVLHVSSGEEYKNVDGTLRVLERLVSDGVDVRLVRAGAPLQPRHQALADSLGVGSRVVDLGTVSDSRLVELYNAAHVFLFPSHFEGFGWPPVEAMACGTPVVTSNLPVLLETVQDVGLVAAPDDVEGLADGVRTLLDGERRQTAVEVGLRKAQALSWDKAIGAYTALYRNIASGAV
jgi:glycosyltransferase involved in cell wall biosynthesis